MHRDMQLLQLNIKITIDVLSSLQNLAAIKQYQDNVSQIDIC